MCESCLHRGTGELPTIAAIGAAAPERAFGIEDEGHPRAIARKFDVTCGDTTENRNKLTGLAVELDEFAF